MTFATAILSGAVWLAMLVLAVAFLMTVWRVVRGPTLPDRVVALDMLVGIVIGFIALIAIRTGFTLYIDIAISLGLVGFLTTVAFARFIMPRIPAPDAKPIGKTPAAKSKPASASVAAVAKKKLSTDATRGKKKR